MKKLFIAAAIAAVLGAGAGIADSTKQPMPTTVHVVSENETLWDIASATTGNDEDVRLVVDKIIKINKLAPNTHIKPGQRLIIPVTK